MSTYNVELKLTYVQVERRFNDDLRENRDFCVCVFYELETLQSDIRAPVIFSEHRLLPTLVYYKVSQVFDQKSKDIECITFSAA